MREIGEPCYQEAGRISFADMRGKRKAFLGPELKLFSDAEGKNTPSPEFMRVSAYSALLEAGVRRQCGFFEPLALWL
jgi:hypothetical protein